MQTMETTSNYPKISIIVPCYNTQEYVERCVDSILTQDYPSEKMEILLVDDGSTDQTGNIIDRYDREYENVTALHQQNGGSAAARNLGIAHATGEYLGFIDSDDYIASDMYSSLVEAALEEQAAMVQIGRDEIAPDGSRLPDVLTPPSQRVIQTDHDFLETLLMHTGDSSYCTKLTSRRLFTEENRFPTGMLNEDFYLLFHMLPEAGKVVILPKTGYHVFYREGSNTRRKAEDKDYFPQAFTDIVKNADTVQEFVGQHYPELTEVAMRFGLVQRLDYMLHIPVSQMTGDNTFYQRVVEYLRDHRKEIRQNPLLTEKQKKYLLLLSTCPRKIRQFHAFLMKIRKTQNS